MAAFYLKCKHKALETLALGPMHRNALPLTPNATVRVCYMLQHNLICSVIVIGLLSITDQNFGEISVLLFSIFMEKLKWNFRFPCQSTFQHALHNHLHYHPRLAQ
jgi:hypothetical protein